MYVLFVSDVLIIHLHRLLYDVHRLPIPVGIDLPLNVYISFISDSHPTSLAQLHGNYRIPFDFIVPEKKDEKDGEFLLH